MAKSIEDLSDFFVDSELDRTVHFTFEDHKTIVMDLFDRASASFAPVGESLLSIKVNLRTGELEREWPK